MSLPALALLPLGLAACAQMESTFPGTTATTEPRQEAAARPSVRPPQNARTADQFDTTTEEERAAAASPSQGGASLGTTVASLGDVAEPGFWLKTPLVDTETEGRVTYPATGKSAEVTLIPIEGPEDGGSRISLAAMRLIEAPLTDLPTLEVYRK